MSNKSFDRKRKTRSVYSLYDLCKKSMALRYFLNVFTLQSMQWQRYNGKIKLLFHSANLKLSDVLFSLFLKRINSKVSFSPFSFWSDSNRRDVSICLCNWKKSIWLIDHYSVIRLLAMTRRKLESAVAFVMFLQVL